MEQQGKVLKDLSVVELKALVYDLLGQREQNEIQIRNINQLILQKTSIKETTE
jgi:hypothetical protein